MDDSAISLVIPETADGHGTARRGRPAKETPAVKLERLQRQLREARQAVAEAGRREREIVGAALLEEAATDSAFKARVIDILRRRVTTASAKADIASLLAV